MDAGESMGKPLKKGESNMRTKLRSRLSLLFVALAVMLAFPAMALADQIANSLDNSVDTAAEQMSLNEGGSAGTTKIYVNPANGDGKAGCNLTQGGSSISVSAASSNTNVATVSPSSFTLSNCGEENGQTITVTPVKAGSATISVSGPSSITVGSGKNAETRTFSYGQGTFNVNVAEPANTAPTVKVTGVLDKSQHEYGSVPKAQCSVEDKEDGNKTVDPTLGSISGDLSSYGLGNQTASCYYKDKGGLEASAAATYEIVDTTAPVITDTGPESEQTANANGWHNAEVTNKFTAKDNVALADPNQASFSKTTNGEEGPEVKVNSGPVKDIVGNEASLDSAAFKIDKSAPVISGNDINDTTWRNTELSQAFTAEDAGSGLANSEDASFELTASKESASASEPTKDSKTVKDVAGNSATRSLSAFIDKTAPSVGLDSAQDSCDKPGYSDWCRGIQIAGFKASDSLSGLGTGQSASFTQKSTEEGSAVKINSGSVYDNAGNYASLDSGPFKIDASAPVISGEDVVDTTWRNTDLSQSFTASDAVSGLYDKDADASFELTASKESASANEPTKDSRTVEDVAGNSATRSLSAFIDKTAPKVEDNGVKAGTVGSNGWYTSAVTNEFKASDALSGLNNLPNNPFTKSSDTQEGSAVKISSGPVYDAAGNKNEGIDSAAFKIDRTKPLLGITDNNVASYNVCEKAKLSKPSSSPSDAVSGLDNANTSEEWKTPSTASGVGSYTYSAKATDLAGHSESYGLKTYKVEYGSSYGGILQPINSDGKSSFKLGSTIPVKFKLMCGTTPINNAVAGLHVKKFDSTAGTVNESLTNVTASTGNQFRYSSADQQYIFNLSTKNPYTNPGENTAVSFSAGTWQLTIKLDDGTTRSITVDLR
jgi:hypothetical protein